MHKIIEHEYIPSPKQRQFHEICENHRFVVFLAGRRTGKTYASAHQAWFEIIRNKPPYCGWICAPTYAMSEILEDYFVSIAPEAISRVRRDNMRRQYEIINGHRVDFKSTDDPDKLRGKGLGWLICDEAAMMSRYTMDVLFPTILDNRGKIILPTTPRGKGWLYEEFYLRTQKTWPKYDPEYAVMRASTWDNPYLDPKDVQTLKSKYTGSMAEQEIEGGFTSFEGMVYVDFDPAIHIISPMSPEDRRINEVVAGVDFGVRDPFAYLWFARIGKRWVVVDEYYQPGTQSVDTHVPHILQNKWQSAVKACYADYHGVEEMQSLRRHGIMCTPARHHEIVIGVNEIKRLLSTRGDGGIPLLTVCSNCRNTIDEFGKYRYPDEKDLKNIGEKPLDKWNHALDALRNAIFTSAGYEWFDRMHKDDKPKEPPPGSLGWMRTKWRPYTMSGLLGKGGGVKNSPFALHV